jgi:hypothetical protein
MKYVEDEQAQEVIGSWANDPASVPQDLVNKANDYLRAKEPENNARQAVAEVLGKPLDILVEPLAARANSAREAFAMARKDFLQTHSFIKGRTTVR